MDTTTKQQRFKSAFEYLRYNGYIQKQKDLAAIMNTSAPNISNALKGLEGVLTDGFIVKFNSSFNNVFNTDWLLTGEGEMLRDQSTTNISSNNTYGDNASGNNNITITRTREEDDAEDKHKEIIYKPVVTKQLASQPDTDVYSAIKEDKTLKLQYIPTIPPYTSIDFYYTIRQDAMLPEYKLGEVLALEHMRSNSDIVQGAAMVVDTSDFGFLFRRIYDRGDYYECRRINEDSVFENQNVPKSKVIRLYRVVYSMKFGD
nr:MAG TPA: repressor [Caudoviricetes sp.]